MSTESFCEILNFVIILCTFLMQQKVTMFLQSRKLLAFLRFIGDVVDDSVKDDFNDVVDGNDDITEEDNDEVAGADNDESKFG